MLTNDLQDNEEIKRQIRSIYCRSNMLIRDFHFCNEDVRKLLYSTFCSNLYCTQLWWCYNNAMFNKVKVAFNNGFRIFFFASGATGSALDLSIHNISGQQGQGQIGVDPVTSSSMRGQSDRERIRLNNRRNQESGTVAPSIPTNDVTTEQAVRRCMEINTLVLFTPVNHFQHFLGSKRTVVPSCSLLCNLVNS